MSKVSFRARALDATKALPIYRSDEIPDLYDYNVINRAVPQMPTGMEKEEESVRTSRCCARRSLRACQMITVLNFCAAHQVIVTCARQRVLHSAFVCAAILRKLH